MNDKWLSANETGKFEDENQQNQTEKIENEEDEGRKFYCVLSLKEEGSEGRERWKSEVVKRRNGT